MPLREIAWRFVSFASILLHGKARVKQYMQSCQQRHCVLIGRPLHFVDLSVADCSAVGPFGFGNVLVRYVYRSRSRAILRPGQPDSDNGSEWMQAAQRPRICLSTGMCSSTTWLLASLGGPNKNMQHTVLCAIKSTLWEPHRML